MQDDEKFGNKQDFFREMYQAHNRIKAIKERIDRLYESVQYISPVMTSMPKSQQNPTKLEDTIIEMADLREEAMKILKKRALFDKFVVSKLDMYEESVLSLRCEKNMGWKEVASSLNLGTTTVKVLYSEVEKKADKFGLFCTEKSD